MQTAKELISSRVVTGFPEQRLAYLADAIENSGAQYCAVIAGDALELIGLVRFSDVAARAPTSNRILSDLMKPPPMYSLKEYGSADAVEKIFESFGLQEISVSSSSGAFAGLITPESYAGWMLEKERKRKLQVEEMLEEQKRLVNFVEAKVAARNTELRETLDEFGTLCLSLSHDIRAPLRSIHGFAEVVEEEVQKLSPAAVHAVTRIKNLSTMAQEVAESILGRARKSFGAQADAFVTIDLAEVFENALEFLEATIRRSRATITARRPLHKVSGYYVPVLQIFINLIGNAIKHTSPGVPPEVEVWSEEVGDSIVLKIKDNGRGIEMRQREKLFRPFIRNNESSTDGTGLGLSIVKDAATGLGGRVEAAALEGAGSVFTVVLQKTTSKQF